MAFIPINHREIAIGEPIKNETLVKVRENFNNLNSRITTIEGGGSTIYPPIVLRVNNSFGEPGDLAVPAIEILKTTMNFNITITGVRILVDRAGISGTTEIDLKYKRAASAYTSIFTTKPSINYSAGDDSISTNAVLNFSEVNLQAGDILRLDITEAQKRASGITLRIDYVKT